MGLVLWPSGPSFLSTFKVCLRDFDPYHKKTNGDVDYEFMFFSLHYKGTKHKFLEYILGLHFCVEFCELSPKIQQTKMLVTCQRFGDWFLIGLVWPYFSNQKNIMKVGSRSLLLTCSNNKLWTYLYYIFLITRES